jgi:hypothetical protein
VNRVAEQRRVYTGEEGAGRGICINGWSIVENPRASRSRLPEEADVDVSAGAYIPTSRPGRPTCIPTRSAIVSSVALMHQRSIARGGSRHDPSDSVREAGALGGRPRAAQRQSP